ncbi:MAG: ASKHA domain-containing protein, partial [Desulfobacteraceae bacterium]
MGKNNSLVRCVTLDRPELSNNTADAQRLKQALEAELGTGEVSLPLSILATLPEKLRRWNHRVKCVVFKQGAGWSVAAVKDPEKNDLFCGIAADIGTTRVVLRLVDLETKETLDETAFDNPQADIAPDVLARIHHAGQEGWQGLKQLQSLVVSAVNQGIQLLCRSRSIEPADVYLFSGAGNTAMTHLFLGVDPCYIIREPYIPAVNSVEPFDASEIGLLINPQGRGFLFPSIGSYFGGDLVAGIYYSGIHQRENPSIMVDVGTNAEVVVGNCDWLMACAGAAGPALEGGVSDMGMTAKPGVIDRVSIDPLTGELAIHTIGEKPPVGVCGSGMMDLGAALFLSGRIDIRGKFSKEKCQSRLFTSSGVEHFLLVDRSH